MLYRWYVLHWGIRTLYLHRTSYQLHLNQEKEILIYPKALLPLQETPSATFHPLENFRTTEILLGKEKARLKRMERHSSWLRIYAIKLSEGVYVITGGAIKLTLKMEEREHTRQELVKLEKVRSFLLNENIIDDDGFVEYMNTI